MGEREVGPYVLSAGEGEARWGVDGALTRVLADAESTGERFAMIEDEARGGEATPMHAHPDEESFYVLEGELELFVEDGPARALSAGSFAHVPAGVPHAFRVASARARYLIVTTPRHGAFYRAISEPAQRRELPPERPMDMAVVEAACARYEVEILGPPPQAAD